LVFLGLLTVWGCGEKTKNPAAAPAAPGAAAKPAPSGGAASLTLYVMSDCPFGIPAEKVLAKVAPYFPGQLAARLAFIVNQEPNGALHSLHGDKELQKDMVHACVGQIAPAKQLEFVVRQNESGKDWPAVAKDLAIDGAEIEKCVKDGAAEKLLRADLAETTKLNVTASPTIILNEQTYQGGVNSRELFDAVCAALGPKKPAVCAAAPDTLSRTDGSASGSCGKRANTVPPELVDDTPVTQTVVYSESALDKSRMEMVLAQNKQLYPNIKIVKVEFSTPEGRKLVEKYHIDRLPAYLFPGDLQARKNFQVLSAHLTKVDDAYLLNPRIAANIFLDRPLAAKTLDVFFTPYSPRAMRMLLDVHDVLELPEFKGLGLQVRLRPYAPVENGQIAAPGGPPELEEMLRVIAVLDLQPRKIWDYLKARGENPASTWWEDYASKAGLDPAALKKAALGDKAAKEVADNSNLAAEFSLADDFALVVDNREIIRPESKDDLKAMLKNIGK
jgi:hypothetical protein